MCTPLVSDLAAFSGLLVKADLHLRLLLTVEEEEEEEEEGVLLAPVQLFPSEGRAGE